MVARESLEFNSLQQIDRLINLLSIICINSLTMSLQIMDPVSEKLSSSTEVKIVCIGLDITAVKWLELQLLLN